MTNYRRVNLFGGPGSGKSALAAWMWGELKIAGHNIEHVPEWVKKWAYEGKKISSYDQIYIFAKQMFKEESFLRSGAELIISDSPILMIGAYATLSNDPFTDELISIANKFNALYPSINIFLDREGIPYKNKGRYQNYEEAIIVDKVIKKVLHDHDTYSVFKTKDRHQILEFVTSKLIQEETND